MPPNPAATFHITLPRNLMRSVLGSLSIFTMLMTVPQVLTRFGSVIRRLASPCSRGEPICCRRWFGFGMGSRSMTRTYICPA